MTKLFFETAQQAQSFLLMASAGFICAASFSVMTRMKVFRPLMDAAAVIFCGVLAGFVLLHQNDQVLRIYHVLGLISGILLCRNGIGKIMDMVKNKIKKILEIRFAKRRK